MLIGGGPDRWAYAKLGVMPPEAFMEAATQQLHVDLYRSVPQDLSNSLWISPLSCCNDAPPPPLGPSCCAVLCCAVVHWMASHVLSSNTAFLLAGHD